MEKYRAAGEAILRQVCSMPGVRAVEVASADESYVEFDAPADAQWGRQLRGRILKEVGVPVSIGVGASKMLARIATKRAKPPGGKGVAAIDDSVDVRALLAGMALKDLPGLGYRTVQKLDVSLGIKTVAQLQVADEATLAHAFGGNAGPALKASALGQVQGRVESKPPESVGSEVSWGVRFDNSEQWGRFFPQFVEEVVGRLRKLERHAGHLTLKIYQRDPNDRRIHLYLGHGPCNIFTKSVKFSAPTSSPEIILEQSLALFARLRIDPVTVRGVGLTLRNFTALDAPSAGPAPGALDRMLARRSKPAKEKASTKAAELGAEVNLVPLDELDPAMLDVWPLKMRKEL